jgi:hypothetical protein
MVPAFVRFKRAAQLLTQKNNAMERKQNLDLIYKCQKCGEHFIPKLENTPPLCKKCSIDWCILADVNSSEDDPYLFAVVPRAVLFIITSERRVMETINGFYVSKYDSKRIEKLTIGIQLMTNSSLEDLKLISVRSLKGENPMPPKSPEPFILKDWEY